jgi:hypothetical protein
MNETPSLIEEYKIRLHQLTLLNEIAKNILSFSDYVAVTNVTLNLIKEYNNKINNSIQKESNDDHE